MTVKREVETLLKIREIDKKIKSLQGEISKLQAERARLDKYRLNKLYEEEQII